MRVLLPFFLFLSHLATAQAIPDMTTFDPDTLLVAGDEHPKVLLVGTFHFDYPNLDSHKTDPDKRVDVAAEERQREVGELLDYLARFKPTKIVVERRPGSRVNDAYRDYLAGERELGRGEIEQIGFRLGKRFAVDSLILGDAFPLSNSLWWSKDSLVMRPLIDSLFDTKDPGADSTIDKRYWELYKLEDEMKTQAKLLDIFSYLNSVHRIRRGHGHYLEFMSDEEVDALAIWWYSRNLRIYNRIRRATTSPEDRILVLIGAGHLSILRQQFESSPAFELIDFSALE